ncbi:hypothetical protein [Rhizobium phaseoli]|uniref:hypothetical protein n=1 Tax=Rhizobium phaseoli TaxID=396 RepID=UPI001CED0C0E|nr:hypothetical protein [Rhizobium phaseoli]MDK4726401.1 hypothetical protein [Rhizobium phaseoli]
MLNDYQKEFLDNLNRHKARFLVIGGVARQHYTGGDTKDLDILIDIDERREAIEAALQEWKQRYAIHTMLDLIPPLALLIAKGRLKELLAEKGLRVVFSGAVDKTQTHRPLVNIYRANGEEIGKKLLREGFARAWSPKQRNDWCG